MKASVEIDNNEIVYALVAALEGGSNYWYNIPDLSMVKKIAGKAMSERITLSAFDGAVIPVYDLEDEDEFLGDISKENIERGVNLYIQDYGSLQADEMDDGDGDILLQLIVMGEVVFG